MHLRTLASLIMSCWTTFLGCALCTLKGRHQAIFIAWAHGRPLCAILHATAASRSSRVLSPSRWLLYSSQTDRADLSAGRRQADGFARLLLGFRAGEFTFLEFFELMASASRCTFQGCAKMATTGQLIEMSMSSPVASSLNKLVEHFLDCDDHQGHRSALWVSRTS